MIMLWPCQNNPRLLTSCMLIGGNGMLELQILIPGKLAQHAVAAAVRHRTYASSCSCESSWVRQMRTSSSQVICPCLC